MNDEQDPAALTPPNRRFSDDYYRQFDAYMGKATGISAIAEEGRKRVATHAEAAISGLALNTAYDGVISRLHDRLGHQPETIEKMGRHGFTTVSPGYNEVAGRITRMRDGLKAALEQRGQLGAAVRDILYNARQPDSKATLEYFLTEATGQSFHGPQVAGLICRELAEEHPDQDRLKALAKDYNEARVNYGQPAQDGARR